MSFLKPDTQTNAVAPDKTWGGNMTETGKAPRCCHCKCSRLTTIIWSIVLAVAVLLVGGAIWYWRLTRCTEFTKWLDSQGTCRDCPTWYHRNSDGTSCIQDDCKAIQAREKYFNWYRETNGTCYFCTSARNCFLPPPSVESCERVN